MDDSITNLFIDRPVDVYTWQILPLTGFEKDFTGAVFETWRSENGSMEGMKNQC